MKKLNLKDIKNGMSRNEMRKVKGGCGSCDITHVESCWNGNVYRRASLINGVFKCC
ncbi:hypothetical protein SAMN05421825_0552 [Epilithonimonas hungarica]|uniref:Natural product n=1 Tax=Epilithonimonas hungarica TaxID=454006 RepID=A0A1G7GRK0_9FLAO|nr:hypothetical protein SAMN05421825_0552 [Epilithonimonas hungarica]